MLSREFIHERAEFERTFSGFERGLERLFRNMDRSYQQTAQAYGFYCVGCENSCCETTFYHHTLVEYFYLRKGFLFLDNSRQEKILQHAAIVLKNDCLADERQTPIRIACPLNENGRCIVYAYRPMICRLHGIPHEVRNPRQKSTYGPGCEAFNRQCGDAVYRKFDRTPFYRQMASLELEFKQSIGIYDKFKMTIAQMLFMEMDNTP